MFVCVCALERRNIVNGVGRQVVSPLCDHLRSTFALERN